MTATVQLYSPHAGQVRLHNSSARFRVMACGRRFGKTLACCNEGAKHALEHAESLVMWVAPTYRQTLIAFRLVSKALKDVLAGPPNKSELRLELTNGSVFQFASAERYDNLRGEGVSFLIMDEVAKIAEEAWTESLRPTLSDTNGRAIFIGTPRGRNWFWRIFQMGLADSKTYDPEWQSFSFPTSANPYVPAPEIASAKRTLPEDVFRQEYLAEFLEEGAGVFRGVDACVRGEVCDPRRDCTYVLGWDAAKYEDFSVMTVLNITTMHVDYWLRLNHMDYDEQFGIVEELAHRYNHALIEMDATGVGDPLVEQLKKRGLTVNGIKFNNVNKEQYVRNLALLLQRGDITFPYNAVLIKELKHFEYHFTTSGNVQYSAPHGEHDDCVTSLMLAAWKAQDRGDIPFEISSTPEQVPSLDDFSLESNGAFLMQRQEQVAQSLSFLQGATKYV